MFGEYVPSNQGTTHDIYGNVRSSAVDGRSPYVTSNYGAVDTLRLQDGQSVQVAAVDGQSPYIVARNNPMLNGFIVGQDGTKHEVSDEAQNAANQLTKSALSELKKNLDAEHKKTKMFLYGSLALNIGLIAYCAMKK